MQLTVVNSIQPKITLNLNHFKQIPDSVWMRKDKNKVEFEKKVQNHQHFDAVPIKL